MMALSESGEHVETPSYVRLKELLDKAIVDWKQEFPEGDSIAFEFACLATQERLEEGQYDG
jgi:hypothetical protein